MVSINNKIRFVMKTINRILVPTDFSNNARAAFEYSLEMAKTFNASVDVVHVYSDYVPEMPLADPTYMMGQTVSELKEALLNFVDKEMESGEGTMTDKKIKVHSQLLNGAAAPSIIELSKDYDLVIMGTAGSQSFGEIMFGSVSTNVSQKALCNVLMIPEGCSYKEIDNLLYACDFDHKSFKHVGLIAETAKAFNSNVHLLFVKTEDKERDNYNVDLRDIETVFKTQAPKLNMYSHIVEEVDVVEATNVYGRKYNADMVVVVTKYRKFWERILHSSVTREMAIYSELPVLVIKASE